MRTVQERLERQAAWARRGFSRALSDPTFAMQVANWLEEHPSGMPDVDRAWAEALTGHGALATWLGSAAPLGAWQEPLPLRCLLSSHPFMDTPTWNSIAS